MPQSAAPSPAPDTRRSPPALWRDWLAVFVAALALYAVTANRGAQWQDSGHHILRIVTGEATNPLGLALSHPLHHFIGRALAGLPFIEPCFSITLISAFAAAVTVANTFGCVMALTRHRKAAWFACASLGIAHTFWSMATVTETYTLTTALLSAECWCVIRYLATDRPRYFLLACLFNGLGISNHMLGALTTPVLFVLACVLVSRHRLRVRHVLGCAAVWCVGASLYAGLIALALLQGGELGPTLHSALFGHKFADNVLNLSPSSGLIAVSLSFVVLSFPNLFLPTAGYGLVRVRASGVPVAARRVLVAALAIHAVFALRYSIIDQYTFFLPSYFFLAIFGGLGVARIVEQYTKRQAAVFLGSAVASLALTPVVYVLMPAVGRHFDVLEGHEHHKPYRDDYVYLFSPWSIADGSAERMSREAVELAGERGLIVVEDGMAAFAVRYRVLRAEARWVEVRARPKPGLIGLAIEQGRPIVLVPLNADVPSTPLPSGSWERVGDLYRRVGG